MCAVWAGRAAAGPAAAALALVAGLTMSGCSDRASDRPQPPATSSVPEPSGTASTPEASGSSSSAGFSPDSPPLVEQLSAQGYQCDDQVRCERSRSGVMQVIELGPGRAVFLARAQDGSTDGLESALASVLEDYGAVLPQGRFGDLEWDTVTQWVDDNSGERHTTEGIAGWHAVLVSEGAVRKLVLEAH